METLERIRIREGERVLLTTGTYRFIKDGEVFGEMEVGQHPAYVRRVEGVRVFRVVADA